MATVEAIGEQQGLSFGLLGPLEIHDAHGERTIHGGRMRALLVMLLLHANEIVSDELLADGIWAGEPVTANGRQATISRLRRALAGADCVEGGCRIVTRFPGYGLQLTPEALDVACAERLIARARADLAQGHLEAGADGLRIALALWRGPTLDGFRSAAFAEADVRRIDDLRLTALEERIDADLALARHREVAAELHELVIVHPLRERLHGQLMLALYRWGRQAEALAVYEDARRTFDEELGIHPGRSLRALHQAILNQAPSLEAAGSDGRVVRTADCRRRMTRWTCSSRAPRCLRAG
jgi:DNA-binding SARP family transcriptional activator